MCATSSPQVFDVRERIRRWRRWWWTADRVVVTVVAFPLPALLGVIGAGGVGFGGGGSSGTGEPVARIDGDAQSVISTDVVASAGSMDLPIVSTTPSSTTVGETVGTGIDAWELDREAPDVFGGEVTDDPLDIVPVASS